MAGVSSLPDNIAATLRYLTMPTREMPDALVGPRYASGATRRGARVGLIPVGSVARSEEWTLGLVVGLVVQTPLPKTCGDLREASQRYAAVSW